MKEYKCIQVRRKGQQTEESLNILGLQGWKLVCSYALNTEWLILERDKK